MPGFYVEASLVPTPRVYQKASDQVDASLNQILLLGPFCGKPACQFINVTPGKSRGVCADAYLQRKTMLVPDVGAYPGHIACDGETKSEIVCPLVLELKGEHIVLGVLDLDCLALNGFGLDDELGLERIAELVVNSCNW